MSQILTSAAAYFAVVFAAAFALGVLRVTVIAPRVGALMAVLIELPIVLVVSWLVSRQVVYLFNVPKEWLPHFLMGALAFLFLMIAEPAIAIFGFGRSFTQYFAAFQSRAGIIGLLGQIAFGLIPLIQTFR